MFFPGVFLSSRVIGACPLRVNVRTTKTTYSYVPGSNNNPSIDPVLSRSVRVYFGDMYSVVLGRKNRQHTHSSVHV